MRADTTFCPRSVQASTFSSIPVFAFCSHAKSLREKASCTIERGTIVMARAKQFRVVLVTCGSIAEARKIAQMIVKKRLAACVNILTTPVESVYRWKVKVEKAREHLLLIKTGPRQLKGLEKEVLRLHSYNTPEFIALPVSGGSSKYLSWIARSLTK